MNDNNEARIERLEQRITQLEAKLANEVARLDKRITESDEGACYYIELHGREHAEITRMLTAAFYKTHPDALETLVAVDKILGTPKDDGSDPQP